MCCRIRVTELRLKDLIGGESGAEVTGFAIDNRKVAPGNVFGAFRGARFNGEDFIAFGEVLEKVAQSDAVAVLGSQNAIESANAELEVTKVL